MTTTDARKEEFENDRKLLHDMATPLTILKLCCRQMAGELKGEKPASSAEKQLERLNKAIDALDILENLHATHKATLSQRHQAPVDS